MQRGTCVVANRDLFADHKEDGREQDGLVAAKGESGTVIRRVGKGFLVKFQEFTTYAACFELSVC